MQKMIALPIVLVADYIEDILQKPDISDLLFHTKQVRHSEFSEKAYMSSFDT